ncbi:histidine triad nucleotide-binding protein [Cognatazoarcus halotolerans]|uniref:histidine triad nucleotide-binding protein n=1 Tax=Cognatazoarcus halotolerans TaxID=2686016 RepID=UPI00135CD498|nr:histidine triad nucleotide-binding protein [Cognatazoarcus halotolerans]MBX3678822.1 histidine triad nucleotide-binding protein [Rhodocyclaceae bacterium]MCB1900452.1 histidine triad nucleotide-binding protein [Rhodocyclaceae bacterium]MCP5309850.1 histidine triad nucleotide-binding protein [Zoogloeaceae bacterium]
MDNCIFCKIAAGEIPAVRVYEDEDILAFPDIQPQRPVHILVIPKRHIVSLAHVAATDEPILGRMLAVAHRIAADQGSQGGFRVIVNTGEIGGQEVMHLHMHIVGGPDPVGPMLKRRIGE